MRCLWKQRLEQARTGWKRIDALQKNKKAQSAFKILAAPTKKNTWNELRAQKTGNPEIKGYRRQLNGYQKGKSGTGNTSDKTCIYLP